MSLSANPLYSNSSGLVGTNYLYPTPTGNLNVTDFQPAASTTAPANSSASNSSGGISGFLSWFESGFSDFAARAGVVLLGFILLGFGFSMIGSQKVLEVAKAAK